MKHHFMDMLNRDGGHWTISENRDRWRNRYDDLMEAPDEITHLTLTKDVANWERVADCRNLIELTLHEPSKDQVAYLNRINSLKALRITHYRPKTLDFIEAQNEIEELVLEYVSGFKSLSPLSELSKLRALHLENLRRVEDFLGLIGCSNLRSLSINGTFDWKQPIESLTFLNSLPSLEYFGTWQVRFLEDNPIFEKVEKSLALKKIKIGWSDMEVENFAYLQANFSHIEGAKTKAYKFREPYRQNMPTFDIRGRMDLKRFLEIPGAATDKDGSRFLKKPASAFFIGKGTRFYEGPTEKVLRKCEDYQRKYDQLVKSYQ